MKTFRQFEQHIETVPLTTSWYLADLGEARGRQELFTMQSPQKLKVLREHAVIESAVSSNRIEGIEIDQARIGTVIFGKSNLRDRDEEEVCGYRDALKLIHAQGAKLHISEEPVRELHHLSRAGVGDAGQYKECDSDIIEKYPDGRQRVRFATVKASDTPHHMQALVLWFISSLTYYRYAAWRILFAKPFILLSILLRSQRVYFHSNGSAIDS